MTSQAEIHEMAYSDDVDQRREAANVLGIAFPFFPNKELAWDDLESLIQDDDYDVQYSATEALEKAFPYVPDKFEAWRDLEWLTDRIDYEVRRAAAEAYGSTFAYMPDAEKPYAWSRIVSETERQDDDVRMGALASLALAFPHVIDKMAAWQDLNNLAHSNDADTRYHIAGVISVAFLYLPDKQEAWYFLHELTQDENSDLRCRAANALGSVFNQVPERGRALEDLNRLAQDEDGNVRCTSNHSLGRISILKATESDDGFRIHLEEAIEFFRKSSEDAKFTNPAAFCLPFYRSLHSLLFTEMQKEEEVQRYLAEAKEAIKGSESREVLLEAVNNLSKALQEVKNYSLNDILLRKRDLKSYTRYCLQTAECLREARDKTPVASKIIDYTLVEKGIPILDQRIKALFRDVESAAGRLCRSTKGTDLEVFGREAYESTKGLNKVESWIAADQYIERIVPLLKRHCNRLTKEAQEHLKTLIDSQDYASLEQRLYTLESVLLASLVQGENDDRRVIELKGLLDLHLQSIEFAIINMKDSSGNARKELYSLKNQIDGLQREIESQGLGNKELSKSLEEIDRAMIDRLNKMREDMIKTVRDTARLNASTRNVEAILKEIDNQDRLKKRDVLGIITDISSLVEMALKILL